MGIRILIADDNPDIVLSLSERLGWMGHEVVSAADGYAALNVMETHTVDLVFLDVTMPRLNGIEVLKRIRKRWPNLPVVVVTAFGSIRLAVEAIKEGAVDFITKPFEAGQINGIVTEAIKRAGQRTEITQLMGEITHDVKNLVMPLVTGTDLLAEEIDDLFKTFPELESSRAERSHTVCEEVIQMFRNSSRRIQDRMKSIADYVALMRMPQKFEPCRIAKIANSVWKSLHLLAEQRQITVRLEGLESLPTLMGDEARVYSLLYNLVNNAIPEVPPGGVIVMSGRPKDDAFIELVVRDTGNGMSPEVCAGLFTGGLISSKPGGTGLGMKIIKDAVEVHGGRITVESQIGQGTAFTIDLPIQRATFGHDRQETEPMLSDAMLG